MIFVDIDKLVLIFMLKGNRTKKAKNNFEKKRIKLDILYYPIV